MERYRAHDLIADLAAYIAHAVRGGEPDSRVLANVAHDLGGYLRDRREDWWCPRVYKFAARSSPARGRAGQEKGGTGHARAGR